jgi:hypothetical protein
LLDADPPPVVLEDLDGELAEAFAASERFRLAALTGRKLEAPPPVVLEGDDAPPTPRDMPEPPARAYDPALSINRPDGER